MVFIGKPLVSTPDGAYRLTWGDTLVVVTPNGGLWLDKRAHDLLVAYGE